MQFTQYKNIKEFHNMVYPVMIKHEAQNIVSLGNVVLGLNGNNRFGEPENWLMATVSDENGILLTAIMTPPFNVTLYATNNKINQDAVKVLVSGLENTAIPGVVTEKNLAECFATAYTAQHGKAFNIKTKQRIYELTEVSQSIPTIGQLRPVCENDMYFFPFWKEAFNAAASYSAQSMAMPLDSATYLERINSNTIYILEVGGMPVSMVGTSRTLATVVGIGQVYTPPYYRGKGYASSAVAQLSQQMLDKGFTKCALYTDLANPTSNSIYQKIGYTPICDSLDIAFE